MRKISTVIDNLDQLLGMPVFSISRKLDTLIYRIKNEDLNNALQDVEEVRREVEKLKSALRQIKEQQSKEIKDPYKPLLG